MRIKLELANMSADSLKKINEIMSISKNSSDDQSSESSQESIIELRKQLLSSIKEQTMATLQTHAKDTR